MIFERDKVKTDELGYAIDAENVLIDGKNTDVLKINTKPVRITYTARNGSEYVIELTSDCQYHIAIFKALAEATRAESFQNVTTTTKTYRYSILGTFVEWLNSKDNNRSDDNRYLCLKDFETYQLNEKNRKNSDVSRLKTFIAIGLYSEHLTTEELVYLKSLIRLTKAIKLGEAESASLSSWFRMPWLREVLGSKNYLQLESPSRLLLSFRVTIATTLVYLLESRQEWRARMAGYDSQDDFQFRRWWLKWNPFILSSVARFNVDGLPQDQLTTVLYADMLNQRNKLEFSKVIAKRGAKNLPAVLKPGNKVIPIWQQPMIFTPNFLNRYSHVEECLASWLIACEAVQPSDILKIKSTDYAQEFNSSGKLIMMQLNYYKGRSGSMKQPAVLMGSDCWTKAMYLYLKELPQHGRLFSRDYKKSLQVSSLGKLAKGNNELKLLLSLWKQKDLRKRIDHEIQASQSSPLFLEAMLALEKGSESFHSFVSSSGKGRSDYEDDVPRPLPSTLFKLTHIKSSAVHARSDHYRDSDLINHHSHTSDTEKYNYLTDANKDWVNQCGRITRLVLNDLQSVVYQPSIDKFRSVVHDLNVRTQIVAATSVDALEARVHPIGISKSSNESNYDDIIVIDSADTALIFIHYINEAEKNFEKISKIRPDFVELTLLPQIEWMTRTLERMKHTKRAQEDYKALSDHLPPLFDYLLETNE